MLLEEQDRSKWNRVQIAEALSLVDSALSADRTLHDSGGDCGGACAPAPVGRIPTDWRQIEALYAYLMRVRPSAVVELNHAAAVASVWGAQGLRMIESIRVRSELDTLMWAAHADLLRRLERWDEAADSYRRALELVAAEPERRFLSAASPKWKATKT